jgi:hypothetical protein
VYLTQKVTSWYLPQRNTYILHKEETTKMFIGTLFIILDKGGKCLNVATSFILWNSMQPCKLGLLVWTKRGRPEHLLPWSNLEAALRVSELIGSAG